MRFTLIYINQSPDINTISWSPADAISWISVLYHTKHSWMVETLSSCILNLLGLVFHLTLQTDYSWTLILWTDAYA